MIYFKKPEGWDNYKKLSDTYAQSIREAIDSIHDINELRVKIHIINMEIQVESFGITWEGPSKKKKMVKRDSKETKELYLKQQEELNELIEEGASTKDIKNKIYRLKDLLNGPKIKPSEPTCINDPVTGELITEREDIKEKSLEHCVKVLSKNEAREEDADEHKKIDSPKENQRQREKNV